jgi:aspartate kinase
VMHGRSIELGKKYNVPIHVRSSFTDYPGTMIMNETPGMEAVAVRGATLKRDITRVTLAGLPNEPGVTAAIFDIVAEHGIFVDDIVQTAGTTAGTVTLGFTVEGAALAEVRAVAELLRQRWPAASAELTADLARVSIIGVGMRSHRGVAAKMFAALAAEQVNIENISTSEIVISVLVQNADGERALRVVHQAFELDKVS